MTQACIVSRTTSMNLIENTRALFSRLISRLFRLVFSAGIVFFSYKKSAGTVFQLVFSAKQTGLDGNVETTATIQA
jgi:hypothetical protein